MKLDNLKIEIIFTTANINKHSEEIAKKYLESKYPITVLRNTSQREIGIPDFKYEFEEKTYYVEVKVPGTCLSETQLDWIMNHPKENVTLLYVRRRIWH